MSLTPIATCEIPFMVLITRNSQSALSAVKDSVASQNAAALPTQIDRANGVTAGSSGRPTQKTAPGSWSRFPQNKLRSFRGPISESRLLLHRLNAHAGDRR